MQAFHLLFVYGLEELNELFFVSFPLNFGWIFYIYL